MNQIIITTNANSESDLVTTLEEIKMGILLGLETELMDGTYQIGESNIEINPAQLRE